MNIHVNAQWIAGTKTYTLLSVWMHLENDRWSPWVEIEVRWKKRRRFMRCEWSAAAAWLESEGAILQEGSSVQAWEYEKP